MLEIIKTVHDKSWKQCRKERHGEPAMLPSNRWKLPTREFSVYSFSKTEIILKSDKELA